MSDLRADVRTMQGLRELASYEPIDTRATCPRCQARCCVLWTIEFRAVAGIKPKSEQMCGACWMEDRRG